MQADFDVADQERPEEGAAVDRTAHPGRLNRIGGERFKQRHGPHE